MAFSGSETPELEWFAGDEKLDSEDQFAIMLAKHIVDLDVEPLMDKVRYTCRATFGDLVEECGFDMDVKCMWFFRRMWSFDV